MMSPYGPCRKLVDQVIDGQLILIVCPELEVEYLEVLERPSLQRYLARSNVSVPDFLRQVLQLSASCDLQPVQGVVTKDRDDDAVIGCAIGGRANYVVSGDAHLLEVGEYQGIRVLKPQEMLLVLHASR